MEFYYSNPKKLPKKTNHKNIMIENPKEVSKCIGMELFEVIVNTGEEAHCADEEIELNFSNGTEWRIYYDKNLQKIVIYSD